jgi:hypothetical protein
MFNLKNSAGNDYRVTQDEAQISAPFGVEMNNSEVISRQGK